MESMSFKERCGIHLCSMNDLVMAQDLILKRGRGGLAWLMNVIHQPLENEKKTNWNLVLSGLDFKSTCM